MIAIARSPTDHKLWAGEIAHLEHWIPRINAEAGAYKRMADSLKSIDPELCADYQDWQKWAEKRAANARARLKQIQDYLAGKIGPWW